jgi:hypothetical protein
VKFAPSSGSSQMSCGAAAAGATTPTGVPTILQVRGKACRLFLTAFLPTCESCRITHLCCQRHGAKLYSMNRRASFCCTCRSALTALALHTAAAAACMTN